MKKKLLSLLAFLSLALILVVGCSAEDTEEDKVGETEDETEEVAELETVKVGYMPNYASNSAVIAGMYTGDFEDEGIEIELIEFADGPTIIAALESGSLEVGYIGPGAHVLPIKGEADIFAWSQLGNADEVIANKSKGVETIEDLKGKKIAVATGTSSEMILDLTLAEAGLTKDDVEVFDMDASAIVTAMSSGSVDAVATWSPNTNAIKNELGDDAIMLSDNERYADKAPSIASWVIRPGFIDENEDLLLRFTRGLMNAYDYRVDNGEEIAGWVAKETALSEESVLEQINDGAWISKAEIVELINDGTMAEYYDKQAQNFLDDDRIEEDDLRPAEDYVLFDLMLEAAK